MKFPRLSILIYVFAFLLAAPFVHAADSICTKVASVSSCVKAINSTFTRSKSASSFCSSILGCTTTPTITLSGTVTSTSTKLFVEAFTFEQIGTETTTTYTYSWTETSTVASATTIFRPTYYVEKFVVTTVKAKRDAFPHPKDLVGRATTITPVCPSTALSKACSCLVTCPTTVTKDARKVIKERTTETSYTYTDVFITYTETIYDPVLFTETTYYLDTLTDIIVPTHTRTIKCTPSVANPSFYLKATNAPPVDNKYVQAYPDRFLHLDTFKKPNFIDSKDMASVFFLDDQSRLLSNGLNGTVYAWNDGFSDFQLFYFSGRRDIQKFLEYRLWAYCTIGPPSGLYVGGYQELTCETRGYWHTHVFQYCPLYVEYYSMGLVLGAEASPETPDCFNITFLVVPTCGG